MLHVCVCLYEHGRARATLFQTLKDVETLIRIFKINKLQKIMFDCETNVKFTRIQFKSKDISS